MNAITHQVDEDAMHGLVQTQAQRLYRLEIELNSVGENLGVIDRSVDLGPLRARAADLRARAAQAHAVAVGISEVAASLELLASVAAELRPVVPTSSVMPVAKPRRQAKQ